MTVGFCGSGMATFGLSRIISLQIQFRSQRQNDSAEAFIGHPPNYGLLNCTITMTGKTYHA
jgi:hypothetical protein